MTTVERRYRLPADVLGGGELVAEEQWRDDAHGHPEYHLPGGFVLLAPKGKPLEPVGLDMAEPPDGTVVRVEYPNGVVVAFRDDGAAEIRAWSKLGVRWFRTMLKESEPVLWSDVLFDAVSITVLEPRRDDADLAAQLRIARDGLERLRHWAEVCERDLADRAVASAHAWYRDETAKLINAVQYGRADS